MRVLLAGIGRFEGAGASSGQLVYMEEVARRYQGTPTAVGGFLAEAQAVGLDILYTPVAMVGPDGVVDRELFAILQTRIMSEMRGWKADAVYLALDGQLTYPDAGDDPGLPELDLLQAMRQRMGPHIPMVVTFDVDPFDAGRMSAYADAVIAPVESLGSDAAARGRTAAQRLHTLLPAEVRAAPVTAHESAAGPVSTGAVTGGRSLRLGLGQDPCPSAAAGETVPLELHITGVTPQGVSVGIFVCDDLGEVRWDVRADREVSASPFVLNFGWPIQATDPPGLYSIRAMVYAPRDRWQGIASGAAEVVDAQVGRRAPPARFPAVPREQPLPTPHSFGAPQMAELEERFRAAEAVARAARNADGSWGALSRDRRGPKHIAIYDQTARTVSGYLIGHELFGDAAYAEEARRGLAFLTGDRLANGAWCQWPFTWTTPQWVFLEETCFYDTGSVGRAVMEAHRVLGDQASLAAVERTVRCVETMPYTGNNNYDAFMLWFLGPYYRATGDERALAHAVARCRDAVLPGQGPYGGFPAHNLSAGYQSIIVYGLMCLLEAMPPEQPYYATLRRQTLMAVNFLIWLMDGDGRFFMGWEYDRTFGVTPDGRPKGTGTVPPSGTMVAALHKADLMFGLDPQVFRGLCQGVASRGDGPGMGLLEAAHLLQWARERGDAG